MSCEHNTKVVYPTPKSKKHDRAVWCEDCVTYLGDASEQAEEGRE